MQRLQKLANMVRILSASADPMTIPEMTTALTNATATIVPADIAILERTAEVVVIPGNITNIYKDMFAKWEGNLTDIFCEFAEGSVSGAPWGAPSTTRIHYIPAEE